MASHFMSELVTTIRGFFFIVSLLFSSATIQSTYTVGALDSILGTNNGGTGYGAANQSLAPGYIVTSTGILLQINGSAIQPDGKAVVVGSVGSSQAAFAQYNINGTIVSGVNVIGLASTTSSVATGVAIQPDGKIVIVGTCTVTSGSVASFFIARYTASGSLDATGASSSPFTSTGYIIANIGALMNASHATTTSVDAPTAVAIDNSGNILVTGTTTITQTSHATTQDIFLVRYLAGVTTPGTLDTTFNSGAIVSGVNESGVQTVAGIGLISSTVTGPTYIPLAGNGIALDNSSPQKILVVGSASFSGIAEMFVARFVGGTGASSGILDTDVTTGFTVNGYALASLAGGRTIAYGVALQSTGKIVVSGVTNGAQEAFVARFTTGGLLDTSSASGNIPFNGLNGYNTTTFGGSILTAGGSPYGIAVQSDDQVVIAGQAVVSSTIEFGIATFVANGSSSTTNTSIIASPSDATTLSMQQNGSFIVAGTVSSGTTNIGVARYLGDIPQGAMNYYYNPSIATSPGAPGFVINPTYAAADATPTPKITAICPADSGNVFVAGTSYNAEPTSNLVQLNSVGQIVTNSVLVGPYPTYDVIMNSAGQIVFVGLFNGSPQRGSIEYLDVATGTSGSPGNFHDGNNLVESRSYSFYRLGQQKSGRYIVIGQASSAISGATSATGLLIAYNDVPVLADHNQSVCPAFGTGGAGAQIGYNVSSLGTSAANNFCDLLIDANDGIYVAYQNISSTYINIAKFLPDGSGLDGTFASGAGGVASTRWVYTSYNPPVLSFDTAGNIVIAATNISTDEIDFQRFSPTTTGAALSTGSITSQTSLLATPVVTKLQCDTNNRLIFTGYDNNDFLIGRCGSGVFTLDTAFAPYSSCPGILKTTYSDNNPTYFSGVTPPYRFSNSVCIDTLGNILFGGYENDTYSGSSTVATTTSLVGQATGVSTAAPTVYTQVPRFPGATLPGTISGTVDLGTTASLADGHPEQIYTYSSGTYSGYTLIAVSNGTDTILSMVNAQYALNTTNFGVSNSGEIRLDNLASIIQIMVDVAGNMYVIGTTAVGYTGDSIIYKIAPDGSSAILLGLPTATATTGLTLPISITEQASGRILIAGYNSLHTGGGSGVILAYNPVANSIDTSFNPSGTPGYWYTGINNPVVSVSVGATGSIYADKIVFSYQRNGTTVTIQRLLENGTALDSAFTTVQATITPSSSTQLGTLLDVNGAIVLLVETTTDVWIARYNPDGTTGGTYGVALAAIINNAYAVDFLCLSDGTTLILAQNAATLYVAKLTPALLLDPTFNASGSPAGILSTTVGSGSTAQVEFWSIDVVAGSAGIIISGDTNATATSAVPYLTQVTNSAAVTKVNQGVTSLGAAGILDTTFNATGTNAGFMDLKTELQTMDLSSATTQVTSLLQTSNGSYFVAATDPTDSYITLMSDDDKQDATFGVTTLTGLANPLAMLLSENEELVVIGNGSYSWMAALNPTTGATISFQALNFSSCYAIAQQSNGRILIVGIDMSGTTGVIVAYNLVTGEVDTTFAVDGVYTATNLIGINSIIVDGVDNIYFMGNNRDLSPTLGKTTKLSPDGNTVLATGGSSPFTTSFISDHLAFDKNGNIIAVTISASNVINLTSYTASLTDFSGNFSTTIPGMTYPLVTSLLIDENNNIVITGFGNVSMVTTPFIARFLNDGSNTISGFDTSFNSPNGYQLGYGSGSITGTTGAVWNDGMINNNGKITVAGYEILASSTNTPYLMRVYGDEFIGQFSPAPVVPVPNDLNPAFGTNGIALTGAITNLINGGDTVIDSQGRVLVGGITSDKKLVVVRFLATGVLDITFGIDLNGITETPVITTLNVTLGSNGYIAIDSNDNVYVAGFTTDLKLIVARFSGSTGLLDTRFNSGALYGQPAGITESVVITNLVDGGYVTIDYLGNVLVGGTTSNFKLVVTRWTSLGIQDTTFNGNGLAQTAAITNLRDGGFIATAQPIAADNSVYVGGSTTDSTLVVAKFDNDGTLATYGTAGIATTAVITNLADGGSIGVDSTLKVVTGGYTSDQTFVAAKFLTTGLSDSVFGTSGIATSNAIVDLDSCPDIFIDNNDNILLGGLSTSSFGVQKSMYVARFTTTGVIDTNFTATGIATTGFISNLVSGGFVAVNGTDNPFVGGYDGTKLVVAELYSGAEIFINNPVLLTGGAFLVYWYGNNSHRFQDFFAIQFNAQGITDAAAHAATMTGVINSLNAYAVTYEGQPNLNLAASVTPCWDAHLRDVNIALDGDYPGSAAQIDAFFILLNARILAVRNTLLASNNN